MKILILSDYDCGYNCCAKVYEDQKLYTTNIPLNYNLFITLDAVMKPDYFSAETIKQLKDDYPDEFKLAESFTRDYDDIILCQDGNCISYKSK